METRFSGVDTLGADTFLAAPSAFAAFLETRVGSKQAHTKQRWWWARSESARWPELSQTQAESRGVLTFHFDVVDGGAHKKLGVYEDEGKRRGEEVWG